jgi:protein-S-isoprenylcysteine O-methyltransferase Ste14
MALREDLETQGGWLFKWRSYLPLVLIPLFLLALKDSELIERVFGDDIGDLWESIAVIISFLGLAIRCVTLGHVPRGTSGRNTHWQAAEVLNTTGMYSITRNPLYLGNLFIIFGVTLYIQVWWLALMVWIGFWLYYERIIFAEEEFLRRKFDSEFTAWAQKTPMLIPHFKNWRKPNLPFSVRTVLRREFSTYFAIVSVYFSIEIVGNLFTERRFFVRSSWLIFFFVSVAIYLTLLILKKKTKVLNLTGR